MLHTLAGSKGGAAPEDQQEQIRNLLVSFRQGNKSAFDRLVLLFQNKIYTLALNYVKQTEEARDLTQEIFITAYRALPQLKEDSKFTAWLYQIAVNHCRNRYKRLKRQGYFISQSLDDQDAPLHLPSADATEKNAEHRDMLKVVMETMASMSETEQEILQLRDIQHLSYEEISEALDLPLGTVKSKLNRARTRLKDKLKHFF
ncbi:MAG: sigma-70 family RNA polymerase sigma factor [Thermodesulfobacteriota bacterium]